MESIPLVTLLAERWLSVFVLDLARYLLGVGTVVVVLFGLARRFSDRHRIQQRRASGADMWREFRHSLKTVAVYATVALGTIALIQADYTRMYRAVEDYGLLYLLASVPLLLVLHDTYFYWAHRLMHHPVLFRHVHRVHHLSRTPTPWAAYAFALGEAVLMALFVPLAVLLLPVHPSALFTFLALMILRNAMGHSGVEFHPESWVDSPLDALTTVTHHDLHHQHLRGNYGLYFTWWDRLMGTEIPGYKDTFRRAAVGQPDPLTTVAGER